MHSRGVTGSIRALVAVALALCLAVVPSAFGATLKPPKWMKRPYRHYTLTGRYAVDTEAGEVDTNGGACDPTTTYQSSFKGSASFRYRLLFGRYRDRRTGKYLVGAVYRRKSWASSANGHASERTTAPSNCAQPQGDNGTCTMATHLRKPDEVNFGKETTHRFYFSFTSMIDATSYKASCVGDRIETQHGFGGPGNGTGFVIGEDELRALLRFKDRAVMRRKRFHVRVRPRGSHHAGTENGGYTRWTQSTVNSGRVTLAPSG